MRIIDDSSYLTPLAARRAARPRLQLEFSTPGARRMSEPELLVDLGSTGGDADPEMTSYYVEVLLISVADAIAEAALGLLDVEPEGGRVIGTAFETRINEALDADLAISIDRAKEAPRSQARVVTRVLKSFAKKSGAARRVLTEHVLDAAFDRLTWRVAFEDVGPRPTVDLRLFVPGSYAHEATVEPLHDLDVAVVYRGLPRAADELEQLTEAMTPEFSVPTPPVVLQARRNAEARTALLNEFGGLNATQVAELAGSEAKNTSALAGRWRREGRILAVEHHAKLYYPGFQFDASGIPKPPVAAVLNRLDAPSMTPWQQALWFTTANGWLSGRRPVDVLDEEPDSVVAAADAALREPVG
jgi:hypothetical protein